MRLADDRFWYVQADGDIVSWFIAHGMDMDIKISDPGSWVSQVQGPQSMDILEAACDGGAPDNFRYFDVREVTMGGQPVLVSRTGWTGELGWEFYTLPGADFDGPALWRHLQRAGAPFGMIESGLDCMDIRRIEAGILNNGSDIGPSMTPFQAGLGMFVDLDKPDFIGKDAMAAKDRRTLIHGIRCNDAEPMIGTTIFRDGDEIGLITAAAWSPYLEYGIGYARMAGPDNWDGAAVTVIGVDGLAHPAELLELPYYDADKHIAHGVDPKIP
jgi:aminomethyltransferase